MHRRNDRTNCFVAGAGRDALPRVRRGTSRRFFLPLCIRALALSGLRLLFASFDVPDLCTFLWTCDAGRAGAHPYHRYSIVRSNHQTQGGFFAATLSIDRVAALIQDCSAD